MSSETKHPGATGAFPWRIVGWSIPVVLLLLPLVAMQFTSEVNWTLADFIFAGVMFCLVGLAFELIVRKSDSLSYRAGATIAVVAGFLTVWANGAVGMIGSEGNPYNLLFGAVLLVALAGSAVARLEPKGMAAAMLATAVAQGAASAPGLSVDPLGALFSMAFAGFWLVSAAAFWRASHTPA